MIIINTSWKIHEIYPMQQKRNLLSYYTQDNIGEKISTPLSEPLHWKSSSMSFAHDLDSKSSLSKNTAWWLVIY